MATVMVHPIQMKFGVQRDDISCDLCGVVSPKREGFHPRALHLVHLVREHLAAVNVTFSPAARAEEYPIEIEE